MQSEAGLRNMEAGVVDAPKEVFVQEFLGW